METAAAVGGCLRLDVAGRRDGGAGQPGLDTAAQQAESFADFHIAGHLTAADLHGIWIFANADEKGTFLNGSVIRKDGSGSDLVVLVDAEKKPLIKIRQTFRWQFDEKKQQFSQWITDYAVQIKDGPFQRNADEIGKRRDAVMRAWAVKGKIDMLEIHFSDNGEKAVFYRSNEERLHGLPQE